MVESWARHWTALNRIEYKTKYIILILVEDFIFILFVFRHHARLVVPYPNSIHYISLHNDTQSRIFSNPEAMSYFNGVPILLLFDILYPECGGGWCPSPWWHTGYLISLSLCWRIPLIKDSSAYPLWKFHSECWCRIVAPDWKNGKTGKQIIKQKVLWNYFHFSFILSNWNWIFSEGMGMKMRTERNSINIEEECQLFIVRI